MSKKELVRDIEFLNRKVSSLEYIYSNLRDQHIVLRREFNQLLEKLELQFTEVPHQPAKTILEKRKEKKK